MRVSRRKLGFAIAWSIALCILGVGTAVAIPSPDGSAASITISGPPIVERSHGATVLTAKWGTEPGQIGLGQWEDGSPSQNPIEIAASPDGATIGVLDSANSRVQLFSRDGQLQGVVPVPSSEGLADIAIGSGGQVFVLTYAGTVYRVAPQEPEKLMEYKVAPGVWPYELTVNGSLVWVKGKGEISYQVLSDETPIDVDQQTTNAAAGVPSGQSTYLVALKGRSATCLVSNEGKSTVEAQIESSELPISAIRSLGVDGKGNFYAMVLIYEEGWTGTLSWDFIGIASDGSCLGQLRLPWDSWAGSGWTVAPDGKILELSSTQAGIEITEYDVEGKE